MKKSTKIIAVGALGYFAGFLAQVVSYLEGIRDIGGTWADFDGISIMSMALKSISTAVLALMAYLVKPPETDLVEELDLGILAEVEDQELVDKEIEARRQRWLREAKETDTLDDLQPPARSDVDSVKSETVFDATIDLSSAGYKNPNARS